MAQVDQLQAELDQSQQQVQSLEQKVAQLQADLDGARAQIAQLEQERDSHAEELARLREAEKKRMAELETYKKLFARLKKLIDAGTIKVSFRDGRMIVELASAVLFDSGRTNLKDAGEQALDELVQALDTVKDREFLIAGHTDDVPIRGGRYKSNWELSAARAITVVKYMIDKGFPEERLAAAGYGPTDPIATNETDEGKAQNRRIEIILMPNLGELEGIREMLEG